MPFYEYQCAACGRHHEELQKVGARPLRQCPHCGRSVLKRLVSAPVFRLKGGGWYETDFKKDQDSRRNLAGEKEPAAEPGTAPEKKKDDKAEAKPVEGAKPEAAKPEGAKPDTGKPAASKTGSRAKRGRLRRPRPRP